MIIGAIGGILVIEAVLLFDRLKVDDPVGATSVHLVNGIWGTLAVGIFGMKDVGGLTRNGLFWGGGFTQLGVQLEAVVAVAVVAFGTSLLGWWLIKVTMGVRVTPDDERDGLDIAEIGMEAYPGPGDD